MSATPPPGSADTSRPTPRKGPQGGVERQACGAMARSRAVPVRESAASAIKKRKKRPTGRGPVIAASPWLECEGFVARRRPPIGYGSTLTKADPQGAQGTVERVCGAKLREKKSSRSSEWQWIAAQAYIAPKDKPYRRGLGLSVGLGLGASVGRGGVERGQTVIYSDSLTTEDRRPGDDRPAHLGTTSATGFCKV